MNALESLEQAPDNQPIEDERELKPTMILIWDELSSDELQGLANMLSIPLGQFGLTKIATILKAIHYKHAFPSYTGYVPQYAQTTVTPANAPYTTATGTYTPSPPSSGYQGYSAGAVGTTYPNPAHQSPTAYSHSHAGLNPVGTPIGPASINKNTSMISGLKSILGI